MCYHPVQDHGDSVRDMILDVDPEVVRKGVRSLMQQVAQIERERVATRFSLPTYNHFLEPCKICLLLFQDDYKTESCNLKKQLAETQETQSKTDAQINNLLTNIRILQDEKNSLEVKVSQKQSGYEMQVRFAYIFVEIPSLLSCYLFQLNALQQKTEECEQLREKVASLELMIGNSSEEKAQCEVKIFSVFLKGGL